MFTLKDFVTKFSNNLVVRVVMEHRETKQVKEKELVLNHTQLDPDYMTTDRLYDLLEQLLEKEQCSGYSEKLDAFVVAFVSNLIAGAV